MPDKAKITVGELKLFLPGIDLDASCSNGCALYTNVFKAAAAACAPTGKASSEGGVENVKADDFTLSGGDKKSSPLAGRQVRCTGDALENGEGSFSSR